MDDLISRQMAIASAISGRIRTLPTTEDGEDWIRVSEVRESLKAVPSAQPEIIRCKDCRNWDTTWQNDWAKNFHYCPMIDRTCNGDWYCADAERRTDGSD